MDELQKLRFDNNILKQKYELADAHRLRLWNERDELKKKLAALTVELTKIKSRHPILELLTLENKYIELLQQNERLKEDCKTLADMGSHDLHQKINLQKKALEAHTLLSDLLENGYVRSCRTDVEAILVILSDTSESDDTAGMCPEAVKNGCPYEVATRENCAHCQDLPVWYFDKETGKTVIVK